MAVVNIFQMHFAYYIVDIVALVIAHACVVMYNNRFNIVNLL